MATADSTRNCRKVEAPANIADIERRYLAGEALNALAGEIGMVVKVVRRWLVERGVTIRTKAEGSALSNKSRTLPRLNPENCYCTRCESWKPAAQFATSERNASGRASHCRECARAQCRRWHAAKKATPEGSAYLRRNQLKKVMKRFGLTLEQYEAMLAAQGGLCAVCGRPETAVRHKGNLYRLAVDHDHETGQARGLLCNTCNTGIGFFGEDPERLERAAAYLRNPPTLPLAEPAG